MPHKADTSVICQCGAIISKYYVQIVYKLLSMSVI